LEAFDWDLEETRARASVLSRAAQADYDVSRALRARESILEEPETPPHDLEATTSVAGPSPVEASQDPITLVYDAEAGAEAARLSYQLAQAAGLSSRFDWATSVIQASRLRRDSGLLSQDFLVKTLSVSGRGPSGLASDSSEAMLLVTPAMLSAARRTRLPLHEYGLAASSVLQESLPRQQLSLHPWFLSDPV